ncbi:unnamed protein product, partial [Prorocentrum cordatum]
NLPLWIVLWIETVHLAQEYQGRDRWDEREAWLASAPPPPPPPEALAAPAGLFGVEQSCPLVEPLGSPRPKEEPPESRLSLGPFGWWGDQVAGASCDSCTRHGEELAMAARLDTMAAALGEPRCPVAAEQGFWHKGALGRRMRVSYSDDDVDHGRYWVWPSKRVEDGICQQESVWCVLSPGDGQWRERRDGIDPEGGPSEAVPMPWAGYPHIAGRRLSCFRARPTLERLEQLAKGSRGIEFALGQEPSNWPQPVMTETGEVQGLGTVMGVSAQELPALGDVGAEGLKMFGTEVCRVARVKISDATRFVGEQLTRVRRALGTDAPPGELADEDSVQKHFGLGDRVTEASAGLGEARGGDTVEDVRTLAVDYDDHGERHKEGGVVSGIRVESYANDLIQGPMSVVYLAKVMYRSGGGPRRWLAEWPREHRVERQDRIYQELGKTGPSNLMSPELRSLGAEFLNARVEGLAGADHALHDGGGKGDGDKPGPEGAKGPKNSPDAAAAGGGMMDEAAAAGDSPTSGVDYAGLPGLLPQAGARDIFPLPLQEEVEGVLGAGHRGGRERRRLLHGKVLNGAISSLNWLAGASVGSSTPLLSDMQLDVVERIDGQVCDIVQPMRGEQLQPPYSALRELMRGRSPYLGGPPEDLLAPYRPGLPSLPDSISEAPELHELLRGRARQFVEGQGERMLRDLDGVKEMLVRCPRVPFSEPSLVRSRRRYSDFVKDLVKRGLVSFSRTVVEMVGIFFVWKIGKERSRMILDCRRSNAWLIDLPSVQLLTAEGLSAFELEEVGGARDHLGAAHLAAMEDVEFSVGVADVKDAFHRMRLPAWMKRLFGLPSLRAGDVGIHGGRLDGEVLSFDDLIYPIPEALPMGCTWSLYLCQSVTELRCQFAPAIAGSAPWSDLGKPLVLKIVCGTEQVEHYVYVDIMGVLGQNGERVSNSLDELVRAFEAVGLKVHRREVRSDGIEVLGVVLGGQRLQTRPSLKRVWRVRQALVGVLQMRAVRGHDLRALLGHCTYLGLVRRPVLSVFHTCYRFVSKMQNDCAPLWRSCREELEAFKGLLPMIVSDWWLPCNRWVQCSDASETGYGISGSYWDLESLNVVGRCRERRRFRTEEGQEARRSALTAAGLGEFLEANVGEAKLCVDEGEKWLIETTLPEGDYELDPDFSEVLLVDNLGVALAFDRSRSQPPAERPQDRRANILTREAARPPASAALQNHIGGKRPAEAAKSQATPSLEEAGAGVSCDTLQARHWTLEKRVQRRYAAVSRAIEDGVPIRRYLESSTVTPKVRAPCHRELEQMKDRCGRQDLFEMMLETLEVCIVRYLTTLCLEGEQVSTGMCVAAAGNHFFPTGGRLGASALPRSRPGDGVTPGGGSRFWGLLMRPQEKAPPPDKVGEFDLGVKLDSAWLLWPGPVLEAPQREDLPNPVRQFDYPQLLRRLRSACDTMQLGRLTPYQARHSVASIDRANSERSQAEVQRHGGWWQLKSMARYEKSAQLEHRAPQHSAVMVAYGEQCLRELEPALPWGRAAPLPGGIQPLLRAR